MREADLAALPAALAACEQEDGDLGAYLSALSRRSGGGRISDPALFQRAARAVLARYESKATAPMLVALVHRDLALSIVLSANDASSLDDAHRSLRRACELAIAHHLYVDFAPQLHPCLLDERWPSRDELLLAASETQRLPHIDGMRIGACVRKAGMACGDAIDARCAAMGCGADYGFGAASCPEMCEGAPLEGDK